LFPDRESITGRKSLEDKRDVRGVHRCHSPLKFHEVLPVLQLFQQVPLGSFLPVGETFENAMPFKEASDLVEAVLQPRIGVDAGHGRAALPAITITRDGTGIS